MAQPIDDTKVSIFPNFIIASPKSTSKSPLQIAVGQIWGEITKKRESQEKKARDPRAFFVVCKRDYFSLLIAAWAAASLAIGTLNGEQLT